VPLLPEPRPGMCQREGKGPIVEASRSAVLGNVAVRVEAAPELGGMTGAGGRTG